MARPHSDARVLVIGLDAVDGAILRQMATAGRLPTIAALLDESAVAPTTNPTGFFVGALWTSFSTSVSPACHGRHAPVQLVPGTYEMRPLRPDEVVPPPFWKAIGRAGHTVTVVDVPHSAPLAGLVGTQVIEWGAHDPALGLVSEPPTLASELVERFGEHPVHGGGRDCDEELDGVEAFAGFRDRLLDGVARKEELVRGVLARDPWSLFVAVFSEAHCAVHQCWHLRDPGHPRHSPEVAAAVGDVIEQVYVALDGAVARILSEVDRETSVFLLASHASGPHYDGSFMLDAILRRIERRDLPAWRRWSRDGFEWAWPRLSWKWQRRHPGFRDRLWRGWNELVPLNPASRRYFAVNNNEPYGGIRINLAGREPRGRVASGPEFDAVCSELSSSLLSFVNCETGQPVVRRVLRTSDVYDGERLDRLPDLLVEWNWDSPISRVEAPAVGSVEGSYRFVRSGDHRPPGLLMVRGPGIAPGPLDVVDVMDIGATIAARLGVELDGVDGRPIEPLSMIAPVS